jgi:hypothetical protein
LPRSEGGKLNGPFQPCNICSGGLCHDDPITAALSGAAQVPGFSLFGKTLFGRGCEKSFIYWPVFLVHGRPSDNGALMRGLPWPQESIVTCPPCDGHDMGLLKKTDLTDNYPASTSANAPSNSIRIELIPSPSPKLLFNGPTVRCCHHLYR